MEIDFSQAVKIPDDVLIREIDGEAVLLNLDSETYFGLDEVGVRMWTHLTDSASIQEAFSLLQAEYDVAEDQLRNDLMGLVRQLVDSGLLLLEDGETD